jgi:hypothetical protein
MESCLETELPDEDEHDETDLCARISLISASST